jgi:hypothetical protein
VVKTPIGHVDFGFVPSSPAGQPGDAVAIRRAANVRVRAGQAGDILDRRFPCAAVSITTTVRVKDHERGRNERQTPLR